MTDDNNDQPDYGPLTALIGVWRGGKGMDVAPEPDGVERNPYYETIVYTALADSISNAESQVLSAVHYRQIVQRQSNNQVFHDESGYWMWESATKTIMQSLTIPRAVCVLAGGKYSGKTTADGSVILEVCASIDDERWQIIQSPFMRNNARTTAFRHTITVGNGRLSYAETTQLNIYDTVFEHTDQNELVLEQSPPTD